MNPVEAVLLAEVFEDGDSTRIRADNDIVCKVSAPVTLGALQGLGVLIPSRSC